MNDERRLIDGGQIFQNKGTDKADAAGDARPVDIAANRAGTATNGVGGDEQPFRTNGA
ncbi:hypothetical protein LTR39_006067, partial [Cryomyces antarcticus]